MFWFFLLVAFWGSKVDDCECKEKIESLVSKKSYIFAAEIVQVGKPPTMWSESAIFNYQTIKYKVHKVIKGSNVANEIVVSYGVIEGTPFADKEIPQLSPRLFYVGRKTILFVDKVNLYKEPSEKKLIEFIEIDSYCSTMDYDEKISNKIDEIIKGGFKL